MVSFTPQAGKYIENLAEELGISEARYEAADRSYKSFGDWLHRPLSMVLKYKPKVYVQGSFGLGTAIRPLNDAEDYDIDAVCEFEALSVGTQSQETLKKLLGAEVASYHKAQAMAKPVREGRRCWILDYADGAQFHMDIVPSVSDSSRQELIMKSAGFTPTWTQTAIAITDNERFNYQLIDSDWCRSNPKGYIRWFRARMQFELRRSIIAKAANAKVEDIPEYRVRTPLHSAIMILKRHRDLRFANDQKNRPISIILTTLAGHAYQGEDSIAQALLTILQDMDKYIQNNNGVYVIPNPTNPMENFADKWAEFPQRGTAFFAWLRAARNDFAELAGYTDAGRILERAEASIGKSLADRASQRGVAPRAGLLRATTAPSASAGLSFPNRQRVPTDPKGFA